MQPRKQGFADNPTVTFLYIKTRRFFHIDDKFFDGEHAYLENDITYVSKSGVCYTARKGLISDGGSIPVFFRRVIGSPWQHCLLAYLIHDQLWQQARSEGEPEIMDVADKLFAEMLEWINDHIELISISALKRLAMYSGVRLGARLEKRINFEK